MNKYLTRILALALIVVCANAFAADYFLKIDGIKGERARIVRCVDGTCAIENIAPGSFTVTVVDAQGNAITTNDFKLGMTFTAAEFRESPSKSSLRESPTRASTGGVTAVTSEVVAPRDAATGQASGKRQHKPIKIVKEWDAASPQLKVETPTGGDHGTVVRWVLEVRVDRIEMK